MKPVKVAAWSCALGSAICALFALAVYLGFAALQPDPLLPEPPAELRARIAQIDDIEHLREVALFLDTVSRASVRQFNAIIVTGVRLLIAAFIFGALCCLVSLPCLLRIALDRGKPRAAWLRWL